MSANPVSYSNREIFMSFQSFSPNAQYELAFEANLGSEKDGRDLPSVSEI